MDEKISRDQDSGGGAHRPRPGGLGRVVPPDAASSDAYAAAANRSAVGYRGIAYRDRDGYSAPYHTDATGPYGAPIDDGHANAFTAPGYGDDSADADSADQSRDRDEADPHRYPPRRRAGDR